jgi:ADP-heptose:LPS heptosyltransferase
MYPAADTWIVILRALRERFGAARVYLTGSRTSNRKQTTTRAYSDGDLARIIACDDQIIDCYDIGLWNQVALLERCDLLLSPHTGFAFLASCVGTPWLALSGGNWPEYFFNDVPFYSVLPDNPDYPYVGAIDGDQDGPRIPCMQREKLRRAIPEILDGAAFLLAAGCTFAQAQRRHQENIARSNVRRDRILTATTF